MEKIEKLHDEDGEKRGKRTGHDQTILKTDHQVPNSHAEAWLQGLSMLIDDHRSGDIVVELNGRLNKCGVISPRFDVRWCPAKRLSPEPQGC